MKTPLHAIAHSRAGDKGDTVNISLIAYSPELYPILVEQVTVERVTSLLADRSPTAVHRFELPKLHALNFVLEGALQGGVNESLNLDSHGKTLSFRLLELIIEFPDHLRGASR